LYLHIGGDKVIPKNDLVAVIDLVANGSADATKEFLDLAASERKVQKTKKNGKNKTCIITTDKVYLSTISAATINKRLINSKII
jgi:regulator of extracellular matrix RemA (YlzA/DUF370 family)